MLLLLACAHSPPIDGAPGSPSSADSPASVTGTSISTPSTSHFVLHGATVVGQGLLDVEVDAGRIVQLAAPGSIAGAEVVEVTGRYLVPAFIDSHVHLAYLPEGESLADGGVAAAVDLAAPLSFLAADHGSLTVLASGPMITADGGYPTQSWGRDGYGLECSDAAEAAAGVATLAEAGARVIKLPVSGDPNLGADALRAAADEAHRRGLRVASHALYDDEADRAAEAGSDVLAHTPVETLSSPVRAAWSGRAVISTLRAFGAGDDTIANLAALRAAGATVLYGTDFGNTRAPGVDEDEIRALQAAGLDGAAILAAGTSTPAAYWGLEEGVLAAEHPASLMVLATDPLLDPTALANPTAVFIRGVRR